MCVLDQSLETLLCSSVADSAVCQCSGAECFVRMDNGPPPDQLGSKARLMSVVKCASEEWSRPVWAASLCDGGGCVQRCVC